MAKKTESKHVTLYRVEDDDRTKSPKLKTYEAVQTAVYYFVLRFKVSRIHRRYPEGLSFSKTVLAAWRRYARDCRGDAIAYRRDAARVEGFARLADQVLQTMDAHPGLWKGARRGKA